jgi:hypothetical protein
VLVSLSAPYWAPLLREAPGPPAAPPGETSGPAATEEPKEVERKINVKLFFTSPEWPGLAVEDRLVTLHADLGHQIRVVVEELLLGSRSGLLNPLPVTTRVLTTFVTPAGVAYVDLSTREAWPDSNPELPEGALRDIPEPTPEDEALELAGGEPPGMRRLAIQGSREELLAVYAVVNSIVVNFPAVRRVQILLDGETASTLAGHVDLSHPLSADMTLLATLDTEPPQHDEAGLSLGPGVEEGEGPQRAHDVDDSREASGE